MDPRYENLIPHISNFSEKKCQSKWFMEQRTVSLHTLTYSYKGRATYIVDGNPVYLAPGDCVYIPKNTLKEAYTDQDDPMSGYTFLFDYSYICGEFVELPFTSHFSIGVDNEIINHCVELNKLWLEKKPGYMLKVRGIFMEILHRMISLLQNETSHPAISRRIEKTKDYILTRTSRNQKGFKTILFIV